MKNKTITKTRGEHCLNIYISFELKERLRLISEKYDRTTADMVRGILKIGIPIMEGISEAEESMIKEYIELFRKFRKMKDLKEI